MFIVVVAFILGFPSSGFVCGWWLRLGVGLFYRLCCSVVWVLGVLGMCLVIVW